MVVLGVVLSGVVGPCGSERGFHPRAQAALPVLVQGLGFRV